MSIVRVGQVGSTFDASTDGSERVIITVGAGGVPVGDLIVGNIVVNSGTPAFVSITDSKGNTWAVAASQSNTGNVISAIQIYAMVTTALVSGDTITIRFTAFLQAVAYLDQFSGMATSSPLDKIAQANGTFGTAHGSGATATTVQADELLIGTHAYMNSSVTWTAGGSATLVADVDGVAASRSLAYQYRIVSATGAYSSDGVTSGGADSANIVATYKAGATVTLDSCLPDADVTTTGWTATPLFSKVNDASDSTVIQATAV